MEDPRKFWLDAALRIASPVIEHAAAGTLKSAMPLRGRDIAGKENCSHLEALGRTVCGLAPWLELPGLSGEEAALQQKWRTLTRRAIARAADPADPARLAFCSMPQHLVDAAFLAQGILRAPRELFESQTETARENLLAAMGSTRAIQPYYNNWLLFSAEIEAFLHRFGRPFDAMRVDYAVHQLEQWYLGDGVYGDGDHFSWDYYNSYVIHPMLVDLADTFGDDEWGTHFARFRRRASRYASHLERMILPDGAYPVIGRSSAYRFGAFHALAQCALNGTLPPDVSPAAARCALTRVIRRVMQTEPFDPAGWLRIGVAGEQPGIGEGYISTGSLYLCETVFLPLGLSPEDPFWASPDAPFTQEKIWSGADVPCDHAEH